MVALDLLRSAFGAVAWSAGKVPFLNKRFRIQDRLTGPFPEGPFLWMHGASLGECKMLVSLAKCLKADFPEIPKILITTQKAEVLEFLTPVAEENGISFSIAPIDTRRAIDNFIKQVKPLMLVLAENELWPGYLASMRARSAYPTVALVSGRFYRCLDTDELRAIGFVSMQTGADLTRFVSAGDYSVPAKTIIGGDWKLLAWARAQKEVVAPELPSVDTVFLSFHFSEWASLERMLTQAMKRKEAVVIVPRFIDELPKFRDQLQDMDVVALEWPSVQKGAVSFVTSYGKIREILGTSKTAVIGGSFVRTLGIHDFWEPLQMGVATCVGPYSRGQQASIEALLREGAIAKIDSPMNYDARSIPDVSVVSSFLSHEREKILASYAAFVAFVKQTLKSE